jgi:hypothetical protein
MPVFELFRASLGVLLFAASIIAELQRRRKGAVR